MDPKTLGWLQLIGGILALLSSGRIGYYGMMGMMGYGGGGYGMMTTGGGLGVSILALLFIITGAHHLAEKHR